LAPPLGAQAQSTSIEDLERKIQAAKEAKAKKEADAARSAGERKAQESRQATLVVQTDAPCTLLINGKETAKLVAGISEVKVNPGQMLVGCASSEEQVSYDGEVEGRSGQNTVLKIPLAGRVEAIRSARAAEQERAAREKRESEARAEREKREAQERAAREREDRATCDRGGPSLMQPTGDGGVVRQACTGLLWTRSDNGSDVNWSQAQSYCRGLGGGWSLPTVAQLQSLYNEDLPGVPCGNSTCKVSDQFRLSYWWFWSSEPDGSSEAWLVNLNYGHRYSPLVGRSNGTRALCVRRP
jgi:hypothetical protein